MKTKRSYLYPFFIALFIVSLFAHVIVDVFWKDLRLFYEPLHSAVEAIGAVAAIIMTTFLLQRKGEECAGKFFLVAMGFLSMGILDGFHAVSKPGHGFVLLRSAATFAGSFWFALTWLKGLASDEDKDWKRVVPWIVIAGSILFGFLTLFARETLPIMVHQGKFTTTAIAINFVGGVLFVAASVRFLMDFHYSERFVAYLFACLSILFGVAGINFYHSAPWDIAWWLWHIQRLLAYIIVLGFVVYEYQYAVVEAKAKKMVEEINKELEKEILERRRVEERITSLNKDLEAANKELEAFSYSVSHDLRAPLRAIDGFSNILLDDYRDRFDDEGKRLLNVVRDNTKKMGHLIEDILQFSRMGRKEISMAEIDMEKLINDVYEEIKASVPERKIQFNVKPLPSADGDPAMLRQVVSNLLSNAVKFTRQKDAAIIEVGEWRKEEDTPSPPLVKGRDLFAPPLEKGDEGGFEKQNIYYIKDNGIGFDMKYADKLFGVFQRLHSMEEFEGTGAGLAIVKRIIHGTTEVCGQRERLGKVLCFILRCPRDKCRGRMLD